MKKKCLYQVLARVPTRKGDRPPPHAWGVVGDFYWYILLETTSRERALESYREIAGRIGKHRARFVEVLA